MSAAVRSAASPTTVPAGESFGGREARIPDSVKRRHVDPAWHLTVVLLQLRAQHSVISLRVYVRDVNTYVRQYCTLLGGVYVRMYIDVTSRCWSRMPL